MDNNISRRAVLAGTGVSVIGSLAGCIEGGNGNGNGGNGGGGNGNGNGGGNGNGNGGSDDLEAYTIGMITPETGTLAPYGEYNLRGLELALEEINGVGIGPDNLELDVIVEDSESSNEAGVNAAQRLINQEGVPMLFGAVSSGVSIAIHESVIQGTDVVQIAQSSSGATVSDYPDLLRPVPSGAGKAVVMADMIANDGHDTIAITWINNDYGEALGNGIEDVFESEYGGTVAYNGSHDPGEASYAPDLSDMAATDATAWVFATYADEATVMFNNAYDQGYHEEVDYYGAESVIADTILENTEPGSQESLKGVREGPPSGSDVYENFAARFEDEYGESPTVYSAYVYDAVHWVAMAIEAADEFTGPGIAEHIREVTRPPGEQVSTFEAAKEILQDGSSDDVDFIGAGGPGQLDENGDPVGVYEVYSVENHEYQIAEDTISGSDI